MRGSHWRRRVAMLLALGALVVGMLAAPTASSAFTGHHCSKSSCRFFTSSYHTAVYYYDRQTCGEWKNLSNKYLQGFRSKKALKKHFDRKLHPPC
jgi:hypothetical protein